MKIFKAVLALLCAMSFSIIDINANETVVENQNEMGYTFEQNVWEFTLISYDEMIENLMVEKELTYDQATKMYPDISTKSTTQRYLKARRLINVNDEYYPTVRFYLYANYVDGKIESIIRIHTCDLITKDYYTEESKVFSGELIVYLDDPQTIYFKLIGDFFNHGTMSLSASSIINLGEHGTVSFSVSNASKKYIYVNYDEILSI